jgi:hypothetical protein
MFEPVQVSRFKVGRDQKETLTVWAVSILEGFPVTIIIPPSHFMTENEAMQ